MNKVIVCCAIICSVFTVCAQEMQMSYEVKKLLMDKNYAQDSALSKSLIFIPTEKFIDTSPFFNDGTIPPIIFPYLTDFSSAQHGFIRNNLSYIISGSKETLPGITTINTAYFGINYSVNRFQFDAGGTLLKYDYLQRMGFQKNFKDALVGGAASYDIFPWLTVGAYGQYSLQSTKNVKRGSNLPTPLIPYSSYGVSSTIMLTPNFGIEGSVGRQLNPFKGKWEYTYGFSPTIRLR